MGPVCHRWGPDRQVAGRWRRPAEVLRSAGVPDATTAAPAATGGRPRRGRRGYLLPGAIALAALIGLAAVINAVGQTHLSPRTLAGPDVATYITQGLQASGDRRGPVVRCPASEPVRAGLVFACTLREAGATRAVRVTETDGSGTFTYAVAPG